MAPPFPEAGATRIPTPIFVKERGFTRAQAALGDEDSVDETRLIYEHTQRGTFIVVLMSAIGIIEIAVGTIVVYDDSRWAFIMVGLVLLTVGWIFSALTVRVTDSDVQWRFAPGWPRKTIARSDIAKVEPATTKWWWGWGIHLTPKGWLYNIAGREAVAIHRHDGKSFLVGTDDQIGLLEALDGVH